MIVKPIADIENRRHQKILAQLMNYNFKGVNNRIADALSRLCRKVVDTHHYTQKMPRILSMSKKAVIHEKQLEVLDPLVVELAQIGSGDPEYVEMLNDVENGTGSKDIHETSELKRIEGSLAQLGIVTLPDGNRLIIKNGCEVLIPKPERQRILDTIHLDHMCDSVMIKQTKGKIFWPNMRKDIKNTYDRCKPCTE